MIRKAMFAGSWYPDTHNECKKSIDLFLKDKNIMPVSEKKFIGGIVPHAGWVFSGSIACNVIHKLVSDKSPDLIVIFGMHLPDSYPCYVMEQGFFETPFGELEIDKDVALQMIKSFGCVAETYNSFTHDNTIELQLPFIKYFFKNSKIFTMGVPASNVAVEIGEKIADIAISKGLRLKVIGSTDLTHYGINYGFTAKGTGSKALDWMRNDNDKQMINTIIKMDPLAVIKEARANQNACCPGAVAAAIAAVNKLGADKAQLLAYATSHDKSPGDSFVGYAGMLF